MADITKCTNESCPLKDKCYRWIAQLDSLYQLSKKYEFIADDSGIRCEYFYKKSYFFDKNE